MNADQYGGVGSILALEFGTDIQLDSDTAPGVPGNNQLQVQVNLANMNTSGAWDNIPMALYLIVVTEGTFTISSVGSAQHQDNPLTTIDVLEAQKQPGINYRRVERLNGGDFLSSLRDFGSRVNDFLKQHKIISTITGLIPHPISQGISAAAKALGYGEGGVALQGGKALSKSEIQSRL